MTPPTPPPTSETFQQKNWFWRPETSLRDEKHRSSTSENFVNITWIGTYVGFVNYRSIQMNIIIWALVSSYTSIYRYSQGGRRTRRRDVNKVNLCATETFLVEVGNHTVSMPCRCKSQPKCLQSAIGLNTGAIDMCFFCVCSMCVQYSCMELSRCRLKRVYQELSRRLSLSRAV